MGLDMMLYASTNTEMVYPENDFDTEQEYEQWKEMYPEVAYWRKANSIHEWFVNNVQDEVDDCGYYPVSKEQLNVLLETVNEVIQHPEKAPELLPTADGFFFGSTKYDQYYVQDLFDTKNQLENILENYSDLNIFYHSSW